MKDLVEKKDPVKDKKEASDRVGRGGGWSYAPGYMRASTRSDDYPSIRDFSIGFRIVRTKK